MTETNLHKFRIVFKLTWKSNRSIIAFLSNKYNPLQRS